MLRAQQFQLVFRQGNNCTDLRSKRVGLCVVVRKRVAKALGRVVISAPFFFMELTPQRAVAEAREPRRFEATFAMVRRYNGLDGVCGLFLREQRLCSVAIGRKGANII